MWKTPREDFCVLIFCVGEQSRWSIHSRMMTVNFNLVEHLGNLSEFENLDCVPSSKLQLSPDEYDQTIYRALQLNSDLEYPLYRHQYEALYNLAVGNDVLLLQPCGMGKTRVLLNGPEVVRRGMIHRGGNLNISSNKCIVNCPLTSIIEDKIGTDSKSGMITMTGNMKKGGDVEGTLNRPEQDFMNGSLQFIYGHPESFTTTVGRQILKVNKDNIVLFAVDEAGSPFLWGTDFRPMLLNVPGVIRVHGVKNAPMLAMTATLRPSEVNLLLDNFGMNRRSYVIIKSSPILSSSFFQVIKRPSNQTDFYAENGLKSILDDLFLKHYIVNPLASKSAIFIFRNEDRLVDVYLYLEHELSEQFPINSQRPFVQYHGSSGVKTIQNVHDRIKSKECKITLFLATQKLLMGVDIPHVDLVVFVQPPNTLSALVQGSGRAGRTSFGETFNSRKSATVILYNKQNLQCTVPGMTDEVKMFCESSSCLKEQLNVHFGFSDKVGSKTWCCSNCMQ